MYEVMKGEVLLLLVLLDVGDEPSFALLLIEEVFTEHTVSTLTDLHIRHDLNPAHEPPQEAVSPIGVPHHSQEITMHVLYTKYT